MLSPEENELVTRTDAGTPMGEVMRRYWMPAALASELPAPDCPPLRVKLLGGKAGAVPGVEGAGGAAPLRAPRRGCRGVAGARLSAHSCQTARGEAGRVSRH